jgi:hypothetical protein
MVMIQDLIICTFDLAYIHNTSSFPFLDEPSCRDREESRLRVVAEIQGPVIMCFGVADCLLSPRHACSFGILQRSGLQLEA